MFSSAFLGSGKDRGGPGLTGRLWGSMPSVLFSCLGKQVMIKKFLF